MTVELQASAPEQTRARYPDASGYVERDGVNLYYEVYGSGEPRCSSCRRGRSSTRVTGRCRSRTSRATAEWSLSTGAATGARIGPTSVEAYVETSSPPMRSR